MADLRTQTKSLKYDFPIFSERPELVYLDSAASAQKPRSVIERLTHYYSCEHANVHRGIYELSEQATHAYEEARTRIQSFLNAAHPEEIIFTRGTTEAINLVAQSFGGQQLQAGDEIILTCAEHHSNIVPWQMIAEKTGAIIRYIPLNSQRRLDLEAARALFNPRTKILSVAHVSNVLGVIHPIETLITWAREQGAAVLIDGAQGVVHLPVDVRSLDCDFYAFSGHKLLGPTGIGVLYGKRSHLESMPPYQGGGDMIETVSLSGSTWADLPNKFEAGTPHIAGAIGLGEAVSYLSGQPRTELLAHERSLGQLCLELLKDTAVQPLVPAGDDWVGIVTFLHPDIHPHDLATICAQDHVCIRAGHHCAQPLMQVLGVSATARVSPYIYNTSDDIEAFVKSIKKAESLFC